MTLLPLTLWLVVLQYLPEREVLLSVQCLLATLDLEGHATRWFLVTLGRQVLPELQSSFPRAIAQTIRILAARLCVRCVDGVVSRGDLPLAPKTPPQCSACLVQTTTSTQLTLLSDFATVMHHYYQVYDLHRALACYLQGGGMLGHRALSALGAGDTWRWVHHYRPTEDLEDLLEETGDCVLSLEFCEVILERGVPGFLQPLRKIGALVDLP